MPQVSPGFELLPGTLRLTRSNPARSNGDSWKAIPVKDGGREIGRCVKIP